MPGMLLEENHVITFYGAWSEPALLLVLVLLVYHSPQVCEV